MMSVSHKTWLLLSAATLMMPGIALAQSQTAPTASPQGAGGASEDGEAPGGLAEIVVTAQQRGEIFRKLRSRWLSFRAKTF